MIRDWEVLVRRFIGRPWQLEIAEGDGPLLAAPLERLEPGEVAPLAQGFDKAWIIQINPDPESYGFILSGREFDGATSQLGLVCQQSASSVTDASRSLFLLSLDMFSPTAEIGAQSAGGVTIKVQGGVLPSADPIGQVVSVGAVFRVARIYYDADGAVRRIDIIPRTYLKVASIDGPDAHCKIISKLRDPLTRMVVGGYKVVAIGTKPTALPTRLRFVTAPPNERPAAGYTLTSRPAPDGPPRIVGTTDREGRIVLEPHFADNLVILRLLAANIEPLDEFPMMPGESVEERTIVINPKADAVTLESRLNSLRDEIVDQVAVRARIEAMIKPRAEAENWEEVRLLLEEFHKLPTRPVFQERFNRLKEEAALKQQKTRMPVLTRTAQGLLADTSALIERYLDDETFLAYEDAYNRYAATAPKEKVMAGTLPTDRPEAALSRLAPPSAATAGLEESKAGLVEFVSQEMGFRVAMPGRPVESTTTISSGSESDPEHSFLVEDPTRGSFLVRVVEFKRTISGEAESNRVFTTWQREALYRHKESRLLVERTLNLDGHAGREIEISFAMASAPGGKGLVRCRGFVNGRRLYEVAISGTEAMVRDRAAELFLDSFRITGTVAESSVKNAAASPAGSSKPSPAPASLPAATEPPKSSTPTPAKPKPGRGAPSSVPF